MERRRFLLSGAALTLTTATLTACAPTPAEIGLKPAPFATREAAMQRTWDKLRAKGLRFGAPIHLIAYKRELLMEAWVEGDDGKFQKFGTYAICSYSGRPGPKLKEGDHQTPEGFYEILPSQMNPWSSYHLSMDLGYPNRYDRSLGRTGSYLAIHGGCLSIGCYAMGNWAIEELYLMVEQSFLQGAQRATFAGYPFRPTKENWDRSRGHRWEGFWRNLFVSHSMFENTRRPPNYSVVAGNYVFHT